MRAVLLGVLVLSLLGSMTAVAKTPLPPYDVTGPWAGSVLAPGDVFALTLDLVAVNARKFAGEAVVNGVPCTAKGKRKRKVVLKLRCADRTKARLKGILDLATDTVAGAGRLRKRGRRVAAQFVIQKVVPAVCGNGAREAGEQCDDGNTAAGDGCSATCTIEIATELDEVEPNDLPGDATEVASLPALAHGAVTAGGDEDFFRVVITGSDLTLETFGADGPGTCGPGTDTIIELRAADGTTVVAVDDDGGIGLCSRVALSGLTPGVYFPCVRAASFFSSVAAYQLLMVGP